MQFRFSIRAIGCFQILGKMFARQEQGRRERTNEKMSRSVHSGRYGRYRDAYRHNMKEMATTSAISVSPFLQMFVIAEKDLIVINFHYRSRSWHNTRSTFVLF